jgi:hypothetical protein
MQFVSAEQELNSHEHGWELRDPDRDREVWLAEIRAEVAAGMYAPRKARIYQAKGKRYIETKCEYPGCKEMFYKSYQSDMRKYCDVHHRSRHNFSKRFSTWTPEKEKELISLYAEGFSYMQIVQKMGLSRMAIGTELYKLRKEGRVGTRIV